MPDHIRKYVTLLCASVIGAALVRGATACSSGAGIAPGDAGGTSDATSMDALIDRAVAVDDAGVEPAPLDGWELYADYDDYCKFYVPKARVNLPAPIRWEPCRANPETSTKSCRQMVLDWKPSPLLGGELISETTLGLRRTNGRVALMSARYQSDGIVRFVAEVDGPMLVAVLAQALDRCLLDGVPSDGDRYAFKVLDSEAQQQVSSIGGGAIGGRLDDFRPTTLRHYHDSLFHDFSAGAPGLLEISGGLVALFSGSDGSHIEDIWTSAQDDGHVQEFPFFFGKTLFWAVDDTEIKKHKVFTGEDAGVRDLLSFGTDTSKGIGDLGTDGQQLVWAEGTDRPDAIGIYPNVTAFVSPFTTDPALIQKRALRSDLAGYGFARTSFVVGCGYAARSTELKRDGGYESGILLIRLADGYAWHLLDGSGIDWAWRNALAITCDEIFVTVAEKPTPTAPPRTNVARVRIDSLGPPSPP